MAVLQLAFLDDSENVFLPHNLRRNQIVYTGTHDNDTTLGWFAQASDRERALAQVYLKTDGREMHWELVHAPRSPSRAGPSTRCRTFWAWAPKAG